jgi:hypothetical protein
MNADSILSQAERSAAHLTNQADRLAHECGVLRGRIRDLCDKLKQYESPSKLEQYTVYLNGVEFQVGAALEENEDDSGQEWPTIVEADYYIRGQDVSSLLSLKDQQAIDEQVIAQYEQGLEDDATEAAISRYEDRELA